MTRRIRFTGFTLIELLVVIGIIAVMLSILLPTLAGARQRAQSVQCLSNLRQVGQAAIIYANENKGHLFQCCPVNPDPSNTWFEDSFYRFSQNQAALIS